MIARLQKIEGVPQKWSTNYTHGGYVMDPRFMSCKFVILNNALEYHWPVHSVLRNRFNRVEDLRNQPLKHWADIKSCNA